MAHILYMISIPKNGEKSCFWKILILKNGKKKKTDHEVNQELVGFCSFVETLAPVRLKEPGDTSRGRAPKENSSHREGKKPAVEESDTALRRRRIRGEQNRTGPKKPDWTGDFGSVRFSLNYGSIRFYFSGTILSSVHPVFLKQKPG